MSETNEDFGTWADRRALDRALAKLVADRKVLVRGQRRQHSLATVEEIDEAIANLNLERKERGL